VTGKASIILGFAHFSDTVRKLYPYPETRNPKPETQNLKPETRKEKAANRHPQPRNRKARPKTFPGKACIILGFAHFSDTV
jgi:hypothetical protein